MWTKPFHYSSLRKTHLGKECFSTLLWTVFFSFVQKPNPPGKQKTCMGFHNMADWQNVKSSDRYKLGKIWVISGYFLQDREKRNKKKKEREGLENNCITLKIFNNRQTPWAGEDMTSTVWTLTQACALAGKCLSCHIKLQVVKGKADTILFFFTVINPLVLMVGWYQSEEETAEWQGVQRNKWPWWLWCWQVFGLGSARAARFEAEITE